MNKEERASIYQSCCIFLSISSTFRAWERSPALFTHGSLQFCVSGIS